MIAISDSILAMNHWLQLVKKLVKISEIWLIQIYRAYYTIKNSYIC